MVTKILSLILISVMIHAADVIPTDHRIEWAEFSGVRGGIPDSSGMAIFTNFSSLPTMAQVNAAVASCPSNQVVKLGTWHMVTGTTLLLDQRNGVVIVGDGAANTILEFTNATAGGGISLLGGSVPDVNDQPAPNIVNWTAGYTKGASNLTFSSVSGLSVGKFIFLDQINDEINVSSSGTEGGTYLGRENGDRCQAQMVQITGIAGSVVTITPPVYYTNINSGLTPQAWWFTDNPIRMSGIESLTVTNSGGNGNRSTYFLYSVDCWIKECNLLRNEQNEQIRTVWTARHTAQKNWFGGSGGASQSYGVNWYESWDCLAVDNIFQKVTAPCVLEMGAGHAFIYNFATNSYYNTDPDWLVGGVAPHGGHVAYCLFEGNYVNNYYPDDIHGSGSHNTWFRSRVIGWQTNRTLNTFPVVIQRFHHCNAVVGNILGQSGYHDFYSNENGTNGGNAIYVIGFKDAIMTYPSLYDTNVLYTLIRKGNYNTFNAAIPASEALGGATYPNSYIYGSKPSFFGSMNWPPYDATVPANSGPLLIPAGLRFWGGSPTPPESSVASGVLQGKVRLRGRATLR